MDSRTGLPVVGMVGGGQLARMTHQAAIALGQSLRVLAASPDDGAALVAADTMIGHHTDLDALLRFAKGCEVVTFDHEHVPGEHIRALTAAGVTVYPGADALRYAQDKRLMRARLAELGAPVPAWRPVTSIAGVEAFLAEYGPAVVKSTTGGYDGRGVWFLSTAADAEPLLDGGLELIIEERVELRRELSALVARSPFGQVAAYPVVETVQRNGICVEVVAPAPGLSEHQAVQAQQLAIRLATTLGVVGLLAVEMFERIDGTILVNELAMRPHNSGHWTIEGARTSQFEQHLRAVLDYPLGETTLTAPVVVMANVLGGRSEGMSLDERLHHLYADDPGARVHLYGKQVRPGRKIGHVTVLGSDLAQVRARARHAARWLEDGGEHT
jgi:5-(carboxyamino)imidazole ribonucleotide synthase